MLVLSVGGTVLSLSYESDSCTGSPAVKSHPTGECFEYDEEGNTAQILCTTGLTPPVTFTSVVRRWVR